MADFDTTNQSTKDAPDEVLKQNDKQLDDASRRSTEFTSENFKLEILNLPRNVKYFIARQIAERHFKLKPHKIRVGDRKAYLAFTSEEELDVALKVINGSVWKGRILKAQRAAPKNDPFKKESMISCSEKAPEPPSDSDIITQICPLWGKSYEEQIIIKDRNMRSILNMNKKIMSLSSNMAQDCPRLLEWLQKNDKLCCAYDGVVPSPIISGYRNKCEFNIGCDGTVGFRVGRYRDATETVVTPPLDCPLLNQEMFQLLDSFRTYLKKSTILKGYSHVHHTGHVRQFTVRTNQKGQSLVIVDLHPQDLEESDLKNEMQIILEVLKCHTYVVSIFFNVSKQNRNMTDASLKLVYGQDHLMETLVVRNQPLQFRIGPTSFFQVNSKATEILYESIIELAQLDPKSLILDVGCGTGTIGLSLAKEVSFVIGIEVVQSAIEDAKFNAQENKINNVAYFVGKAEDLISECISILKSKKRDSEGEIIAIVDPPRTGFNNSFVKTLRGSGIRKVIYVACDAKANDNLTALCRPTSKAYQGAPFVPTRAKAFDLFPYTKFCELVIVYERLE